MFLPSLLNEYCTVENSAAWTENSRRMRTQLAIERSSESWALWPACRNPGPSARLERPRATSKSSLNAGCFGTRESAEEISFCSSAEGLHTFNTLTLTGGCWAYTDATAHIRSRGTRILGNTQVILSDACRLCDDQLGTAV